MKNPTAPTVPAMPAAKRKRSPTLRIKMPCEAKEEQEKKDRGRYSLIVPREKNNERSDRKGG